MSDLHELIELTQPVEIHMSTRSSELQECCASNRPLIILISRTYFKAFFVGRSKLPAYARLRMNLLTRLEREKIIFFILAMECPSKVLHSDAGLIKNVLALRKPNLQGKHQNLFL